MNIPELDNIEINNINNNNIKQILNDLSAYLKHKYNIMDNFDFSEGEQKMSIPPEWYITSFCKSLEKIDDKYKKKEYEKFFIKYKKNIENSIEEYGFDYIGQLSDSLNIIKKNKEEQIEMQKIFDGININSQIIEFINTEIIEVEIKFKYNEKDKYLKINKKKKNYDNENNHLNFDEAKICYNILEFTQNFPDLIFFQKYFNTNLFDIESEIRVGESLNYYFEILNESILSKFNERISEKV